MQVPVAQRTWYGLALVLVGARHHLCGSGSHFQKGPDAMHGRAQTSSSVHPQHHTNLQIGLQLETGEARIRCGQYFGTGQQILQSFVSWTSTCDGVANGSDAVIGQLGVANVGIESVAAVLLHITSSHDCCAQLISL